ncbi:hypothetical protein [Halococcus salifodinae]|uniref:Uncharacterized protein n=1 Tax=Halococcus salifodinae DSM 8989 TaxID=1227456 RepID=M0N8Q5_9EURY|nr:hypothetical protein [Halococcus salifodinae]EMA54261.1 hypothetical protein C450_06687 [Halococcus salifodinae DSM 8989]
MDPPPRDAFVRELRGMDRGALVGFVADLESARGGTVERTDEGLIVDRPTGECRRLVVATTHRRATDLGSGADPDVDAVVVGRAVDGDTALCGVRVVDAVDLHAMALYAVDRGDLPSLLDRHFGGGAFADAGGGERLAGFDVRQVRSRVGDVSDRQATGAAAGALLVVALAALVVTAAPAAVPWVGVGSTDAGVTSDGRTATGAEATGGQSTPGPTTSPTVPAGALGATDWSGSACPRPPRDAHPATLRPEPVAVATAFGLDGWAIRLATNVSSFRGPNELSIPYLPEIRHKTSYRSPSGGTVVLTIDRWPDEDRAAVAGAALAADRTVALRWGRYTMGVIVYQTPDSTSTATRQSGSQSDNVDPRRSVGRARVLLSHVTTPDGLQLGTDCVAELTTGGNATAAGT